MPRIKSPTGFPTPIHVARVETYSAESDSSHNAGGETDGSTHASSSGSGGRWSKFVKNLYEMATNSENAAAIGFSDDGNCLEIRDPEVLKELVLNRYFKHSKITSFIRQLNNYGFKTVPVVTNGSLAHCFTHEGFRRGRKDLLDSVIRKGTSGDSNSSKVSEELAALRSRGREMETRINQLTQANEQMFLRNRDLFEENKRLKSTWPYFSSGSGNYPSSSSSRRQQSSSSSSQATSYHPHPQQRPYSHQTRHNSSSQGPHPLLFVPASSTVPVADSEMHNQYDAYPQHPAQSPNQDTFFGSTSGNQTSSSQHGPNATAIDYSAATAAGHSGTSATQQNANEWYQAPAAFQLFTDDV